MSVSSFIKLSKRIAPEVKDILKTRYSLLRSILYFGPVGRRNLSYRLNLMERRVRNELKLLEAENYITITGLGAEITPSGEAMIQSLDHYIKILCDLDQLEEDLKESLGIKKVIVVPSVQGESCSFPELGRFAATYLKNILKPESIVAVAEGSTLACIADVLEMDGKMQNIKIVPARGGLGEELEYQANTIAARMAQRIGGIYYPLYLPDQLSSHLVERLKADPEINQVLHLIHSCDILLIGIGNAMELALQRNLKPEEIEYLKEKGAVGETLGHYFDGTGRRVYSTPSLGLDLEEFYHQKRLVIAVAGGERKEEAIFACILGQYPDVLITDEATSLKIMDRIKGGGYLL